MRTEEDRERARRAERYRRIAIGLQPRTRLCRTCGAPAQSSSHWYCRPCAAAVTRSHRSIAERINPKTSAEKGYGNEHVKARRKWKVKVDGGECTCAFCGRPIIPGTYWDLSHPFDEKSMPPEPWHRRCNRQYAATITKARRRRQ